MAAHAPRRLQENFPVHSQKNLQQVCPRLDPVGIDLLSVRASSFPARSGDSLALRVQRMLQYDPAKRVSAEEAMKHPVRWRVCVCAGVGSQAPRTRSTLTTCKLARSDCAL
jgi:hypothetical protein